MKRKQGQEIKKTPTNWWLSFYFKKSYAWATLTLKKDTKGLVKEANEHYNFIWPFLNSIWFTRTKKEVYDLFRQFLKEEKK